MNTDTQKKLGNGAPKAPQSLKTQADARERYLKPVGDEKSVGSLFAEKWVLERIASVLPKHLTAERLAKIAVQCILKTPQLLNCSKMSLVQAVLQLAELGLEPSGMLGLAHLLPYGLIATPIIGWRGYVDLARRSGLVGDVRVRLVYEKDKVERWEGLDEHFRVFPFDGPLSRRGKIISVYSVAEYTNGGKHLEIMDIEEVDAIREKTRAAKGGRESTAWTDPQSYPEMVKKTNIRRAQKMWPLSTEYKDLLEKASSSDADDVVEGEVTKGKSQVAVETPDAFFSMPQTSQEIEDADVVPASEPGEGASSSVSVEASEVSKQAEMGLEGPPPGLMGPDELADELISEMRKAPDLKTLASIGAKARGLPSDLEKRVTVAFMECKDLLGKKVKS